MGCVKKDKNRDEEGTKTPKNKIERVTQKKTALDILSLLYIPYFSV